MRWPAEWEPHEAVWIGFPGDPNEWPVALEDAQREVAAFANAVSDGGKGEQVLLICRSQTDVLVAQDLVEASIAVELHPFGDIWLRDTGPVITVDNDMRVANLFRFNGWGNKFDMPGDLDIGARLSKSSGLQTITHDWVLEGGAIDGDGSDWVMTTEQCVLNRNRNSAMDRRRFEQSIGDVFGRKKFCWLGDGLENDHTDGHVDNLARFVGAGKVAIPESEQINDPNMRIFEDAASRAQQQGLHVVRLASVGKYLLDEDVVPASYMNFYVGNKVVAVPQYEASNDSRILEEISALFPDRKVMGLSSKALLRGGGSFHCISQQIPQHANK
ncbi:MAG: agmatine deiminase family protein [Parasphingorhabdus sp.]